MVSFTRIVGSIRQVRTHCGHECCQWACGLDVLKIEVATRKHLPKPSDPMESEDDGVGTDDEVVLPDEDDGFEAGLPEALEIETV